jgi:uncharacterized membrane protein HdeD (DUF308 family)
MADTPRSVERWRWPGLADRAGGWSTTTAVIFAVLGLGAVIFPGIAGLTVTMFVAWLLVFGAFANAISAFNADGVSRVVWQVIVAIVYFVGGIYLLMHPALALNALTLLLASILFAEAVSEFVAYAQAPRDAGAGWLLVNGIVTTLLGLLILIQWPLSSVWAIGTLLGVNLFMTGIARLMQGSTRQVGTSVTS